MQAHSRYTDVGDITVHLFASSSEDRYGPSRAVMSINNGGAGTHFSTALHLTAEQCERIAAELNDAAEFMRQAPSRRVEQGQGVATQTESDR